MQNAPRGRWYFTLRDAVSTPCRSKVTINGSPEQAARLFPSKVTVQSGFGRCTDFGLPPEPQSCHGEMMQLVLASQSPRRKALLKAVGIEPKIVVPAVDETPLSGELPIVHALRVATNKALAVNGDAVLAADTVVALEGAILAKPADEAEAIDMLTRLSDRTHTVHTAVVLVIGGTRVLSDVASTRVRFRRLTDQEIRSYAATKEPMDKAGAYGIQGEGGALVAETFGSYTNVVGLPIEETLRLLRLGGVIA
jgi:septum formation protein